MLIADPKHLIHKTEQISSVTAHVLQTKFGTDQRRFEIRFLYPMQCHRFLIILIIGITLFHWGASGLKKSDVDWKSSLDLKDAVLALRHMERSTFTDAQPHFNRVFAQTIVTVRAAAEMAPAITPDVERTLDYQVAPATLSSPLIIERQSIFFGKILFDPPPFYSMNRRPPLPPPRIG